jgi:hypothetical protein
MAAAHARATPAPIADSATAETSRAPPIAAAVAAAKKPPSRCRPYERWTVTPCIAAAASTQPRPTPKTANAAANTGNGVGSAMTGRETACTISPSASAVRLPNRTATALAITEPKAAAIATPRMMNVTTSVSTSCRAWRAGRDVTITA